jgi:hypothetical protein
MATWSPIRYIYISSTLAVRSDATATANNIAAHETLFRLCMVGAKSLHANQVDDGGVEEEVAAG